MVIDELERKGVRPGDGGSTLLVDAVRALDDGGAPIADIVLRRPTLDDVFLSLTGHAPKTNPLSNNQTRAKVAGGPMSTETVTGRQHRRCTDRSRLWPCTTASS